jgi:hypothetical protein
MPKVSTIKTNNLISTVTLNYPLLSKIRYVMVYSAKDSKLDINNPSVVDNCFWKKKDSISITIPQRLEKTLTVPSLTLIITGMKVRLLWKYETKTPQSPVTDENR